MSYDQHLAQCLAWSRCSTSVLNEGMSGVNMVAKKTGICLGGAYTSDLRDKVDDGPIHLEG